MRPSRQPTLKTKAANRIRWADMAAYNVGELIGAMLDAAVAKAGGIRFFVEFDVRPNPMEPRCTWHGKDDGSPEGAPDFERAYSPSTEWAIAGPIIERERLALIPGAPDTGNWGAHLGGPLGAEILWGPTPLIAAMRAYVASKFGETIELP